jgi:hypothetical protein
MELTRAGEDGAGGSEGGRQEISRGCGFKAPMFNDGTEPTLLLPRSSELMCTLMIRFLTSSCRTHLEYASSAIAPTFRHPEIGEVRFRKAQQ